MVGASIMACTWPSVKATELYALTLASDTNAYSSSPEVLHTRHRTVAATRAGANLASPNRTFTPS